jgi:hypothetical protein
MTALQSASADSNRVELSEYLGDASRLLQNSVRELRRFGQSRSSSTPTTVAAKQALGMRGVIFLPEKYRNQLHGKLRTEAYE